MTDTGFSEDCCWTWIRDHCRDAERCACACHTVYPAPAPTCGHEAEIERYRQKSRDEDTARIRLNHERIKAQELAASLSDDWHRVQKVNARLIQAVKALGGVERFAQCPCCLAERTNGEGHSDDCPLVQD